MPKSLRFGIHSLDELLGKDERDAKGEVFTTSVCIVGPNGSGKSIFGLHMASRYLADCIGFPEGKVDEKKLPAVLYVSTDFTFNMANKVWSGFALNRPFSRIDAFGPIKPRPGRNHEPKIELKQCNPTALAEEFDLIEEKRGDVVFIDIASHTAGDDWGFLHKLLSLLPKPDEDAPRHLVIIDAIEGFEALAGELNAFGEESTRRSRVAQVLRLAAGKCHLLLVVEESKSHEILAEEFIADTVIRLENISTRNYERRVLKIEKARGQSHIRGQHHYSIRSGSGSTTGSQVNPDDPVVLAPNNDSDRQSYIQVFHSIHRLNRKIMEVKGKARKRLEPNKYYAAFGIKYLDNMLGGNDDTAERRLERVYDAKQNGEDVYYDARGLPCRSTTALVGDSLTQKSTLGKAFLCRCFHLFDKRLAEIHALLKKPAGDQEVEKIWKHVSRKLTLLSDHPLTISDKWETKGKAWIKESNWIELLRYLCFKTKIKPPPFLLYAKSLADKKRQLKRLLGDEQKDTQHLADKLVDRRLNEEHLKLLLAYEDLPELLVKGLKDRMGPEKFKELKEDDVISLSIGQLTNGELRADLEQAYLTHLAAWLLDYNSGLAVMLTTLNTHNERLTEEFISWLHSDEKLKICGNSMRGYKRALENYIKGGTICRRLEIHSLSSEILIHVVLQAVKSAQRKILTAEDMQSDEIRYEKSWPIRVVIDDFSTFRDIFPELREDPLLLPTILFHFEREGVTTLIVDTQSGKPDTTIAERFESELRKLVQHNLYTWRVPFYGESRVAMTAIPPFSYEYAGIVRELRWESESLSQQNRALSKEPAVVDPHFELYTGLEEGKPQSVPLRVHFYAETPAMESYIEMENNFLKELFIPLTNVPQTDASSVIVGVPPTNYNELRDVAYLSRDTRLDYTLVCAVDEFWMMRPPKRHKRAGAFQPQWPYLNAVTADLVKAATGKAEPDKVETERVETEKGEAEKIETEKCGENEPRQYEPDPDTDPYQLFQPRGEEWERLSNGPLRRRHFYETYYEDYPEYTKIKNSQITYAEIKEKMKIDRVPFTWDFGFLLCQQRAWDTHRTFKVTKRVRNDETGEIENKEEVYSVRQVWQSLIKASSGVDRRRGEEKEAEQKLDYVPWRVFIEACKKAAEAVSSRLSKPVTAFDFAQISPESFSCLILEMWFSEIYDTLSRTGSSEELKSFRAAISKRRLSVATPGSKWETLSSLLEKYWLELYKSWLLLIEVLNFSDIVGEATAFNFDFKSKNTDFSAVASRHWYKTASQCPDEIAAKEPLVAVRLPGHFSVRGDWFLAVSGSSRSIRQAERAVDLLNSRRANVTRLQIGLGLPTRFSKEESTGRLRTRLISHDRGQDNVEYGTFLNIAANIKEGEKEEFYWLWRSSLSDYAHSNRIWHKWLNRVLLSWYRNLLRYKSVWKNSFAVYDDLTNYPPQRIEEFAPRISELDTEQRTLEKFRKRLKDKDDKMAEEKYNKYRVRYMKRFRGNVESLAQLKVRGDFRNLWEVLLKELEQATETDQKG